MSRDTDDNSLAHLGEAIGPLSKEKDKLQSDHNHLKDKLSNEYEELAEQKRNYQQEVKTLVKMASTIKEYRDLRKGERLKELQEKHSSSESLLQSCGIRKKEIEAELGNSIWYSF